MRKPNTPVIRLKWPALLSIMLATWCVSGCADLVLPINPEGSEGQICTGLFVTGEPFELCRRQADGALGAFDVFIKDLVVTGEGDVVLTNRIVVGHAEITQSFDALSDSLFDSSDETETGGVQVNVFWQLKNTDNTLLRLRELAANAEVVASLSAGDADVAEALLFIDSFISYYFLNANRLLAAEAGVNYGIDHFLECVGQSPATRDPICATLYDLDLNGTLFFEDYIDLIAIVEGPEAAAVLADEFADGSEAGFSLSLFYFCAGESEGGEEIPPECIGLDANSNGLVDQIDLQIFFNGQAPANFAPIANAGEDQEVGAGATATLNGSASLDLEGTPLAYAWVQLSGPVVSLSDSFAAIATFTAPSVDQDTELKFQLTVTDEGQESGSDTVAVTVVAGGPQADAGADQFVVSGDSVTLNGSGSDGEGLTFAWLQTSGTQVALSSDTTQMPIFTAPTVVSATVLTFSLAVRDSGGLIDRDTVDITVQPTQDQDATVRANAGPDQQINEGQIVLLDGSASEGNDLTYAWEQIAGEAVTLSATNTAGPAFITPPTSGDPLSLSFRLTVFDGQGNSDSDTVDITVLPTE